MPNSRKMIIEVLVDSKQAEAAIRRTNKEMTLLGRNAKLEQATRGGLSSFGGKTGFLFGSSAFVGAASATAILKTSIDAASDLNEQVSRSQVVFGKSAEEIRVWSDTLARGFGIANTQGLAAASTFGAMFEQAGKAKADAADLSKQVVQLAGDLASFANTTVDDALNALRSGLSGEIEPLRRYQVFLTEAAVAQQAMADTGKTSSTQLTQGEKILARYELIMKQTSLAQGDFARTSGGLANQQRILAAQVKNLEANLGKLLLPTMTNLVSVLNQGTSAALDFGGALQTVANTKIPVIGTKLEDVGRFIAGNIQFGPLSSQFLKQFLSSGKQNVIPATGARPPIFGTLTGATGSTVAAPTGPFGGAQKLVPVTQLSSRLVAKELDARIAGSRDALRNVLVKEADFLRKAIENQPDLKLGDRNKLKQALLGVVDEIRGIDKGIAADLEDQATEARRQREKLKQQAEEAKRRREEARRKQEEARVAEVQARSASQFRALGLTAAGEPPVPGVANLRKQLETLQQRLLGSSLATTKRVNLLKRIGGVLLGEKGEATRDVRARIAEMFDGIRQELKDQLDKTTTGQLTKTTTLGFAVLQGLGLSRDEERRLRARLSRFNSAGVALAPTAGAQSAFGTVVGGRPVVVESRVTLNLDGKPVTTVVTREQQRAKQRNPAQRRGR